jgi:phospho-N-acetylmuramoyl-pentapeptide-transferase
MFLEFLYPLTKYFTPLNVFQYLTFRGAYAALTTLLVCFLFGPAIIAALRRLGVGQAVRSDGPSSHLKKEGTPTMGGVMIILSVLFSMLLWQDLASVKVWLTLGAFAAFGAIGFVDDLVKVRGRRPGAGSTGGTGDATAHTARAARTAGSTRSPGIRALTKLILQFAAAGAVVIILYFTGDEKTTELYLPFFKSPVVNMGVWWIPFAMVLIVGESNAVNLSDGLDGLAAGLLIPVFITLAILTYLSGRADYSSYLGIPYIAGSGELTVFCLAALGACVGFLWFNAHPASIFMGDVGSLSLGGVIATVSLIIKKEILILVIGGVFVLEAASVILQVLFYKLTKKRLFRMAPIHHAFELAGWAETQVVIRFWILGGLFAIIALSTLKIQ